MFKDFFFFCFFQHTLQGMKDAILGVNTGKYNTVPETNMQENLESVAKKNDKK